MLGAHDPSTYICISSLSLRSNRHSFSFFFFLARIALKTASLRTSLRFVLFPPRIVGRHQRRSDGSLSPFPLYNPSYSVGGVSERPNCNWEVERHRTVVAGVFFHCDVCNEREISIKKKKRPAPPPTHTLTHPQAVTHPQKERARFLSYHPSHLTRQPLELQRRRKRRSAGLPPPPLLHGPPTSPSPHA
jgi:hypothetical protein